jgi:sulfoxide reductase heme-binding subunit YedZ
LKTILNARPLLWALLALPAAWIAVGYAREDLFYGQVIHVTGDTAVRLLIVTMAASPLALMFPGAAWTRWLIRRRREFGVAAFGYALLHTVVYALRKAQLDLILTEGLKPGLLTGWIALALMLALAVTSNDVSVRLLKRAWKRLHWLVYPAAALTFGHWLLEAYDTVPALVHGAILLALVAARFVLARRRRLRR